MRTVRRGNHRAADAAHRGRPPDGGRRLGFHFRAGRLKLSFPSTERTLRWKCLQVVVRILATLLFDLKVYGRHNVPARGGALIVSNHQGNLDAVLLAVRLDRPLNFIAKSELFQSRWTSWILHTFN